MDVWYTAEVHEYTRIYTNIHNAIRKNQSDIRTLIPFNSYFWNK